MLVAQSCPTLCNPMDYRPPGSSVHGILQARILEWVVIAFSRGHSWPRDWTHVSCIAGRFSTMSHPIVVFIFQSQTPNLSLLAFPLQQPEVYFLYLQVCFCFVNKVICINILDSTKCISEIIYLFFSVWLTSLNMIISRSIHVAANGIISFFSWLSNTYTHTHTHTHHIFFIHSSIDGHLGCWLSFKSIFDPDFLEICVYVS